ncbi:MAG: isoprenylcysteine carboxylmethyltransferase family protein [Vulcanimicrobiaceae bacterium]
MTAAFALLGFLTLQRGAELAIATHNTHRIRARGGYEAGAGHYPVMVALHATWLATLWWFGRDEPLVLPFVVAFAALQLGRAWVLTTLGGRWTTRIMIVPEEAPVTDGPFRFVRHPNYLVVALELPCVSLALGLVWHALLFGALNLAMLAWRIRAENRAFAAVPAGVRLPESLAR